MSVYDCIDSAFTQGAISKEEADSLKAEYANLRAGLAAAHAAGKKGLGAGLDEEAQRVLQGALKEEAERQKLLSGMAVAAQNRIRNDLVMYRDAKGRPDVFEAAMRHLENFGFSGFSSVRGRQLSIVSLIHGEMGEGLRQFERNFFTGFNHQQPLVRDVVREMLGETSGNPEARAFADAARQAFEKLRNRFNTAGGDIGKVENYLPQFHDPAALNKAGFDTWRDAILPRLDTERMHDPLTGGPLTPARLDESLRAAFDKIVTGGWDDRLPSAARRGAGMLANRRGDERFFQFKSADDWMAYDRDFGRGDPVKAIFQHINGMARDIAAMEVLGPNPSATVEWLKQVVHAEHGRALIGDDASLFRLGNYPASPSKKLTADLQQQEGRVAANRVEDLWEYVRGRQVVSQTMTRIAGDVRNVLTSIQLGSAAITAATTDPMIEKAARGALDMPSSWLFGANAKVYLDTLARGFADLPILKSVSFVVDKMTGAPREEALRSGLIMDEFLHVLGGEARYAGTLGGNVWSRWVADRTLMLSGLTPLTEARRAVFALDTQAWLADNAGKALKDLPPRLSEKMQGYGITPEMWDRMRETELYRSDPAAAGLLRPIDVARADRGLAEKMLEMILGETERAIPTSNLRAKSAVAHGGPQGTWSSELLNSFLQYRSFGLSLLTLQMEAVAHESALMGRARGAAYASQLVILTTLGGAAAIQLKQLAQGRDPQNMKDARFWMNALATGGGLGLYGDFLFADLNRFGQSFGEQLAGPMVSMVSDLGKLTVGTGQKLLQGKDPELGKALPDFARRYTPVLSSLWYTRAAYNHILLDQLQYQFDPKALRRWRQNERTALRERGQGAFWPSGELSPSRLPDLSTVLGSQAR